MATDKALAALTARLERIEATLGGRFPPIIDPSPDDLGRWIFGGRFVPIPFPRPDPGDPVPIDISRLSRAQLLVSLETIRAQRIRLDALEGMIQAQIKQTKG